MTNREKRGVRIEAVLALVALALALVITFFSCELLAPRVSDPFSVLCATLFVTMIFINSFGACAIVLLLPWHIMKHYAVKPHGESRAHHAAGGAAIIRS